MANLRLMQQQADAYNQQLAAYSKEARTFGMAADVYNQQLKEYQALVDAYNTNPAVVKYNEAIKNYNDVLTPQYNQSAAAYNKKLDVWKTGSVTVSVPLLGNRTTTPEKAYNMLASYSGNPAQTQGQRDYLISTFYPGAAPSAPTQPAQPNVQRPGDFTAVKPEMTAVMPKDPGFTGQQMKQLLGQPTLAQQEMQGAQETGLIERMRTGQKQKPDSLIGGMLQNVRYST